MVTPSGDVVGADLSKDLPARIGPFQIIGLLGRGGMGVVYDALSPDGERVALKVIRPQGDLEHQQLLTARFMREAKILEQLSHPCVVRLLDAGDVDGVLYLAMERIEGVSLLTIRRKSAVSYEALLPLGVQLADALAHMHEHGIIHRDIKPANILIDSAGNPIITDFGISGMSEATGITRMGDLLGSPGFMAPEVTEGAPPSELSDQFALGRLLYELGASGPAKRLPKNAPIIQVLSASLEIDWNRFPKVGRWPGLEGVLRKMLASRAQDRYPNARQCKAGLEALVTHDVLDTDTLSDQIERLGLQPTTPWSFKIPALDEDGSEPDRFSIDKTDIDQEGPPAVRKEAGRGDPVVSAPFGPRDENQDFVPTDAGSPKAQLPPFPPAASSDLAPPAVFARSEAPQAQREMPPAQPEAAKAEPYRAPSPASEPRSFDALTSWTIAQAIASDSAKTMPSPPPSARQPSTGMPLAWDLTTNAPHGGAPAPRPTPFPSAPAPRPTPLPSAPALRPTPLPSVPVLRPTPLPSAPALRPTPLPSVPALRPTPLPSAVSNPPPSSIAPSSPRPSPSHGFSASSSPPPPSYAAFGASIPSASQPVPPAQTAAYGAAPLPGAQPISRIPTPAKDRNSYRLDRPESSSASPGAREEPDLQIERLERQVARLRDQLALAKQEPRGRSRAVIAGVLAVVLAGGAGAAIMSLLAPEARPGSPPIIVLVPPGNTAPVEPVAQYGKTGAPSEKDTADAKGIHDAALDHLANKDMDGAEALLRQCIKLADLPECHRTLGTLLSLERNPAARTHLEHYLNIAPASPDAEEIRRLLETK